MMNANQLLKIPSQVTVRQNGDKIRLELGDLRTNWISPDDPFIERIQEDRLNRFFFERHLIREIEVKNVLDEGIRLLNLEKYKKAIDEFDNAIYFDESYGEALICKSRALYGQGHFVKALRFYKKSGITDNHYHRMLLKKSSEERDSFPKIKRNIYAGDEAAAKGDFSTALEFYDKALINPSKFKNRILYKLLNKKSIILVKLGRFDEALASFDASIAIRQNDHAYFGRGYCQYKLGLKCTDSLKKAVNIDKRYLPVKARILNEFEFYNDALESLNIFLDNHFALDDDFKFALSQKAIALDGLGLDSIEIMEILNSNF